MNKFLIIFVLGCLCISTIKSTLESDVRNSLIAEARKVASGYPSGWNRLIRNLRPSGNLILRATNSNSFEGVLNSLRLPNEVADRFKNIIWSQSLSFQTFAVSVKGGIGTYDEYLGAARNYHGSIEIGYFHTHTYGSLVPQYYYTHTQSCHSHCGHKHCHTYSHRHSKGYSSSQINAIQQTLRANCYSHVMQQL